MEERIESLEQECRRLARRLNIAVVVILCLAGATIRIGFSLTQQRRQIARVATRAVVRAQRFELRDGRGKLRGVWHIPRRGRGTAGIWMHDPRGHRRLMLAAGSQGGQIVLGAAGEFPVAALREEEHGPQFTLFRRYRPKVKRTELATISLGFDAKHAFVALMKGEKQAMMARVGTECSLGFSFEGHEQLMLRTDGKGPMLRLLDSAGSPLFQIPRE